MGSYLTESEVDEMRSEVRATDRSQAQAISKISGDNNADSPPPPLSNQSLNLKNNSQEEFLQLMQSLCNRLSTESNQGTNKADLTQGEKKIIEGILRSSGNFDTKPSSSTVSKNETLLEKDCKLATLSNNSEIEYNSDTPSEDEDSKTHQSLFLTKKAHLSSDESDISVIKRKKCYQRKS